jgi:hypothetical protein
MASGENPIDFHPKTDPGVMTAFGSAACQPTSSTRRAAATTVTCLCSGNVLSPGCTINACSSASVSTAVINDPVSLGDDV